MKYITRSRPKRTLASTAILVATGGCPDNPDEPIDITITITATGGLGATGLAESGLDGVDETGADQPPFPGDPLTFHIEETIDFTNSQAMGCQNTDVNQVGNWLVAAFEDHGFTGSYVLDENGTAYDFIDSSSPLNLAGNGLDGVASDAQRVSIYAGHGNANLLQWGHPGPTPPGAGATCATTINQQMRLGTLDGDTSGFAMYVTSCTANIFNDNLGSTLGQSQIGQHVGWHNSPVVSDFMPGAFVSQTATSIIDGQVSVPVTNRDAWLGLGQSKPGFGENSPVIYTTGQTAAETIERHFAARLALGIGISEVIPEPQNRDVDNISWIDNGCSDACNGC